MLLRSRPALHADHFSASNFSSGSATSPTVTNTLPARHLSPAGQRQMMLASIVFWPVGSGMRTRGSSAAARLNAFLPWPRLITLLPRSGPDQRAGTEPRMIAATAQSPRPCRRDSVDNSAGRPASGSTPAAMGGRRKRPLLGGSRCHGWPQAMAKGGGVPPHRNHRRHEGVIAGTRRGGGWWAVDAVAQRIQRIAHFIAGMPQATRPFWMRGANFGLERVGGLPFRDRQTGSQRGCFSRSVYRLI